MNRTHPPPLVLLVDHWAPLPPLRQRVALELRWSSWVVGPPTPLQRSPHYRPRRTTTGHHHRRHLGQRHRTLADSAYELPECPTPAALYRDTSGRSLPRPSGRSRDRLSRFRQLQSPRRRIKPHAKQRRRHLPRTPTHPHSRECSACPSLQGAGPYTRFPNSHTAYPDRRCQPIAFPGVGHLPLQSVARCGCGKE